MRQFLLTLILAGITIVLHAQATFEVPEFEPQTSEDYTSFKEEVIKCIDWLIATPFNTESEKRTEANAFLIKWLSGSPSVHLSLQPKIVTFLETSPDLFLIYMGGYIKYVLESNKYDDAVGANMAGIETVIDFYTKNSEFLTNDKNVEKYIKMKEKGKLEAYIKKNS